MKKLLPLLIFAIINGSPLEKPMFPNMILRCDEKYENCHWECEWGVNTSTAMINENYLIKPDGCLGKPEAKHEKNNSGYYWNYGTPNIIPL